MDKLSTEQLVIASVRRRRREITEAGEIITPDDLARAGDSGGGRTRRKTVKEREPLNADRMLQDILPKLDTGALNELGEVLKKFAAGIGDVLYQRAFELGYNGNEAFQFLQSYVVDVVSQHPEILLGDSDGVYRVDANTGEFSDEQIVDGKEFALFLLAVMMATREDVES